MRVVICIKQVPNTNEVGMDLKTNTLIRQASMTKINPDDLVALEAALRLKDDHDCHLTSLSMGPISAQDIIKYSYSLGVDEGVLLNDYRFGGADVYATSYTLSKAVERLSADLIICGKETIDGDTGQVGPCLAAHMSIPHIYNVQEILEFTAEYIIVTQKVNDNLLTIKSNLPCLIVVDKNIYIPRFPLLKLKLKANKKEIHQWSYDDLLDCDASRIGLKGSPTKVTKIYLPELVTQGQLIEGDVMSKVEFIVSKVKEAGL